MNFYETKMGHTFFEHQLPQLISALKELTEAVLQAKTQRALKLPADVPSDFLKELYYGNFEPDTELNADKLREYNKPVIERQKRLKELVDPDVWEQVEEYRNVLSIRAGYEIEQAFETGFRTAVRMIAAGLSTPPHKETEQTHE